MPATYPCDLPAVPGDRWNAKHLPQSDLTETTATTRYLIDADSADEAERRLLAYIDKDYEDDLRGATATAEPAVTLGRWLVTLVIKGEF